MPKARVLALYLPQYHPTPENDKYWGKGFTEWTNVAKAKPLFPGHYQPHLPADLGFYDLRLPQIREQQAELARNAGIEGFMYWHYWFGNGRQTLERPFREVLESGKPDFPFCLAWANHSWTNGTWTKSRTAHSRNSMIFEQTYPGDDDYRAHFEYCLPAFRDHRYVTVDGKPIFAVWNPDDIPDAARFISLWRRLADEAGLPGIHFVAIRTLRTSPSRDTLLSLGFDAVNESNFRMWQAECAAFGSQVVKRGVHLLTKLTGIPTQIFPFRKIIRNLCSDDDYREDTYPTILSGYDRSPRAGSRATIYTGVTPEHFAAHVDDVLRHVEGKSDQHKIVFLKSWNEWGEGNYIEPDLRYGSAMLDALAERLAD